MAFAKPRDIYLLGPWCRSIPDQHRPLSEPGAIPRLQRKVEESNLYRCYPYLLSGEAATPNG